MPGDPLRILACADANDYLAKLSWTSWTPGLASATGVNRQIRAGRDSYTAGPTPGDRLLPARRRMMRAVFCVR